MREHVHLASRRRDERLALIRKLTVWITGGAAAASLALGVAFAAAIPGHASAGTSGASATTSGSTGSDQAESGSAGTGSASSGSGNSGSGSSGQLAPPAQQPTQTTAPPVVTSGGS